MNFSRAGAEVGRGALVVSAFRLSLQVGAGVNPANVGNVGFVGSVRAVGLGQNARACCQRSYLKSIN
jgi:hypothetical protein